MSELRVPADVNGRQEEANSRIGAASGAAVG